METYYNEKNKSRISRRRIRTRRSMAMPRYTTSNGNEKTVGKNNYEFTNLTMKNNTNVRKKVIFRRIPYTMTKDAFIQLLKEKHVNETYLKVFIQGKKRGNQRKPYPGRAYFDFKGNQEAINQLLYAFKDFSFDFENSKAPVEIGYAIYQKLLTEKKKKSDRLVGTIEEDNDYKEFIESLATSAKKPSKPETKENNVEEEKKEIPALVKFLIERQALKQAQKNSRRESLDRKNQNKQRARKKGEKKKEMAASTEGGETTTKPKSKKNRGKKNADGLYVKKTSEYSGGEKPLTEGPLPDGLTFQPKALLPREDKQKEKDTNSISSQTSSKVARFPKSNGRVKTWDGKESKSFKRKDGTGRNGENNTKKNNIPKVPNTEEKRGKKIDENQTTTSIYQKKNFRATETSSNKSTPRWGEKPLYVPKE